MRLVLTLAAALITGGLVLGTGGSASAGPLPSISSLATDLSVVETVGWRRDRRRNNRIRALEPIVNDDVIVETGDDIVIIAPVRPASCGQYHFWNGAACVDARYYDPYLGPR